MCHIKYCSRAGISLVLLPVLVLLSIVTAACGSRESSLPQEPLNPAIFETSNLSVTPSDVMPGENVNIMVQVTNTGGVQGSYNEELKIGDVVEHTWESVLNPGESANLSFTVSKELPGTYDVQINGLTGQFKVAAVWFLTDEDAERIWGQIFPGVEFHFTSGNNIDIIKEAPHYTKWVCSLSTEDGKLCIGDIPKFYYDDTSTAHEWTEYRGGKMYLTKAWFDTTKEINPDVTELPYFESVSTSEGEVTIKYRWP